MGRPASPIHDAGNHRADGRRCRHQPARRGILIKQARAEHHGDDQRQLHHSKGQHRARFNAATCPSGRQGLQLRVPSHAICKASETVR